MSVAGVTVSLLLLATSTTMEGTRKSGKEDASVPRWTNKQKKEGQEKEQESRRVAAVAVASVAARG